MSGVLGFPGGSDSNESACNMGDPGSVPGLEIPLGDPGSVPGLEIPLGEVNGYPLQCSCLENSKDREPGGL